MTTVVGNLKSFGYAMHAFPFAIARGEQTMPSFIVNVNERLSELGLSLPDVASPVAAYVATQRAGDLLFISGQLPRKDGKLLHTGLVGRDVTLEQAQECAKLCGLHILAQLKAAVGLDKIKQCVKLTGFVASTPEFGQQSLVINGTSQLLVDVLGEQGKHSRSAVGVAALPLNAAVEVEAIFLVG
jgi:enamine deaminase RidA (YjgF/YER057c/UK114 family)